MKAFNKSNVAKIEDMAGVYKFYDAKKRILYVGKSDILKHRLQSYYQEDCPIEHNEKIILREKIKYFAVRYFPKKRIDTVEKSLIKKHRPRYNQKLK